MDEQEEPKIIDSLIVQFFEVIDTYYDERAAAKIRQLLVNAVDKGLLEELRTLALESG